VPNGAPNSTVACVDRSHVGGPSVFRTGPELCRTPQLLNAPMPLRSGPTAVPTGISHSVHSTDEDCAWSGLLGGKGLVRSSGLLYHFLIRLGSSPARKTCPSAAALPLRPPRETLVVVMFCGWSKSKSMTLNYCKLQNQIVEELSTMLRFLYFGMVTRHRHQFRSAVWPPGLERAAPARPAPGTHRRRGDALGDTAAARRLSGAGTWSCTSLTKAASPVGSRRRADPRERASPPPPARRQRLGTRAGSR